MSLREILTVANQEILFTDILPFIASCVVGEDRSRLVLAALGSSYRHQIRQEIESTPQSERLAKSSAEDLSSELTAEEQLQLLALIPSRELVTLVDRQVLGGRILVEPEELRRISFSPPRTSRHDLRTEMSSLGLRSPGRLPLVRLQTTIIRAYTDSAALDDLRWRIRAPEGTSTRAALAGHIRQKGPLATVCDLVIPERLVFEKVSHLVFLQSISGEPLEQVTTRLLWKLGFDFPRYGSAIPSLRRRLDEFNQCLLRLGEADSEEDREQIRRSGVNLFVSLEDFLERLVSYNLGLCASDHFIDTKFFYNRHDVVAKVPAVLGTSVRSGAVTFSWSSNGENTIGTTQSYLWKLLDWLSQQRIVDRSSIRRSDEDFPYYVRDPHKVFSVTHLQAWADFDRAQFEVYIGRLKEIAEQLAKSDLAGIRNGLDHKRPAERFPTVDSMLAMVSRLLQAVETADVNRLIPKRFWLEERQRDRYGHGTLLLKDYRDRSYSLGEPMVVVSMSAIRFGAPVIIAPGSFLADGTVPLVLSVRSSGEYAKYWAGYPRRRQIPPPKIAADSAQGEHGDGAPSSLSQE